MKKNIFIQVCISLFGALCLISFIRSDDQFLIIFGSIILFTVCVSEVLTRIVSQRVIDAQRDLIKMYEEDEKSRTQNIRDLQEIISLYQNKLN